MTHDLVDIVVWVYNTEETRRETRDKSAKSHHNTLTREFLKIGK
jgi:hypothetical protein